MKTSFTETLLGWFGTCILLQQAETKERSSCVW